jgi:tetratricopeptide (TPR) repeat protein
VLVLVLVLVLVPRVLGPLACGPPRCQPAAVRIGRYDTERELGRGAMGVVYAARDPEGRPVALKLLLPGTAARERRFEREVEALLRMRHENVLRLLDAGEHQGWRFLVTELIEGETLEQRLTRGPLEPVEAARITRDIARGLAHAHEHDVLHRDVKPSNVLLEKSGRALLVDFGLTRDAATPGSLTQSGQLLGTPGFWSPEQARGARALVGPKTDVFGAGATLYAALTQEPPAQGESMQEVLIATCERAPTPPSGVHPGIDRDLEEICLRALEKEPDERFESAAALADALDAWLSQDDTPAPAGRSRVVVAVAALAATALVVVTVAVALATGRTDDPPRATTTTTTKDRPVAPVTEVPPAPPLSPAEARAAQVAALTSEGWAQLESRPTERGPAAFDDARASFDAALALEPRHARALAGRSQVSVMQGDLEAALEHAELAVELDPQDAEAWYARANVRLFSNEEERALPDLERALELAPDHVEALSARGWIKFELRRDTKGALEDYTRAIETGRAFPMTYVNRALAREDAGDHEGALADLDAALATAPSSAAHVARAHIFEERGELQRALADYDRALELSPQEGHTLHTRGLLKRRLGDVPGGRADLQRSVELEPDNPMAWLNLGNLCQDDGDLRAAERAYTRALEKRPRDFLAWLNRGNLRVRLDDPANARADLDEAVKLEPQDPRGWLGRGLVRELLGDLAGAAADWEQAAKLDERDPVPVYNRARVLNALSGPESALAEYDRALQRAPTMGQALAARGVIKQALGDLPGAIADWLSAKEHLPPDAREQPELDRFLREAGSTGSAPVER